MLANTSMRRFWFLALLTMILGAAAGGAQDPFVLKVDVSLVTLDVVVLDSTGRPVTTLTRDDFEVYEDGVRQEVRSFTPVDSPYSILLLFDCSASTQPHWPFLVESMNRFTSTLRTQDSISVSQFGGGYKMLLDWRPRGTGGLDIHIDPDDSSCSQTDFYGAINQSLSALRKGTGRRGAIVLTDGVHNDIPLQRISAMTRGGRRVDAQEDPAFQRLLRAVKASDSAFYFIAVNTDLNPAGGSGTRGRFNPEGIYDMLQVRSRMEQLAEVSGGRMAYPKSPGDVVPLFEQIGRELGTSYGLGYPPGNPRKDGTYRKIEVRVRDKSLQVRQSRAGYEAR